MKQAKRIFWNAMLLTGASLLMRTVGVGFQVAVSNRAGAETMGLFSLMSGVYGFALTLATSGIHLGVTRVVADALGRGEPSRVVPAMRRAVLYSLCFGVLSCLLLTGAAEFIGTVWLKDARTVSSLRLFGLTLPLISLSSAFGGYFVAVRRVWKNAAVQVTEQALKIGFTMYLLVLLLPGGIESACRALVLGGAIAELLSFLLDVTLYYTDRRRNFPNREKSDGKREGRALLHITLPIALTTYIRSGLVTIEHILIPEGLRNSGSSHGAALAAYGSIHSMALPIILYPSALIYSFSGLLVPELAECRVRESYRHIRYIVSRVLSLSLLFSLGVSGILICFSSEIGNALYPGTDTARYLRILAPLIPIMYVDGSTDAMLRGLGEQVTSMNINIADALISVVLVWLLIPRYGIDGYLVTIYFSELFNTVLSITRLLTVSRTPVRLFKWVYKPLFSIVGATCAVRLLLTLCGWNPPNTFLAVALPCFSVLLFYAIFLLITGSVDREDLSWFATLFRRNREDS